MPDSTPDLKQLYLDADYTPTVEQTCLRRIASSYKLPDALKAQAAQRLERTAL